MNTFCLMTLQRYKVPPSLATAFHLNEKEKSLTLRGIFSMMHDGIRIGIEKD